MHLSSLQWTLIFAELILQVVILVVMVRRSFRAKFPVFFSFIVFSAVTFALQIPMLWSSKWYSQNAYFGTYWTMMAGGVLFTFAMIRELFVHVLKPYTALVDLGKILFRWAVIFVALASILSAVASTGSTVTRICYMIDVLDRGSALMVCGLLLLFISFERRLGLPWRVPASCIIVGLGANSALYLTILFLRTHFPSWDAQLGLVEAISCVALYGVWCVSFLMPQPAHKTVQDSPSRLIFQRWNEALLATPLAGPKSRVATMAPIESFLPGVERTVERVMMARRMMD